MNRLNSAIELTTFALAGWLYIRRNEELTEEMSAMWFDRFLFLLKQKGFYSDLRDAIRYQRNVKT